MYDDSPDSGTNKPTLTTSSDFAKFSRKVGNNRTVINTSVVIPVKGWPKQ